MTWTITWRRVRFRVEAASAASAFEKVAGLLGQNPGQGSVREIGEFPPGFQMTQGALVLLAEGLRRKQWTSN